MISRRTAIATGALGLATGLQSITRAGSAVDRRIRLTDGRWLGYRHYGALGGPAVFYFHGLPGCRLEAELIACEAHAVGVDLIAVDRPGMGQSSYDPRRTICGWVEDVRCLADSLGRAAFAVMGMSGGAPYACACARFLSDRVSSMAIVSGHAPLAGVNIGPPGGKERMLRFAARRPRLAKCAFDVVRARLYRRPNRVLRRLTSSWSERDQRFIMSSDLLRNMFLEGVREAVRCGTHGVIKEIELLTKCWGFRLCEIPNMPVSIWHGACDPLTPPAMGHYFHNQIQSSEFFLQPDGGHITTLKCNATEILFRLV